MKKVKLFLAGKKYSSYFFTINIYLILFLIFTPYVNAGWFGYDTYEECWEKEPGKLMSRMFSPLPKYQAQQAAREVCKSYPYKYEYRLRQMSDSELVRERKLAVIEEAKRDKRSAEKGFVDMRKRLSKYIDAEIRRRENR
jgi:hypothetical protein